MSFTHQSAVVWAENDKTGVTWDPGTEKELAVVTGDFDAAQNWATGTSPADLPRRIQLRTDKADMASRARYAACIARQAEQARLELGVVAIHLGDFVLYDMNKGEWSQPIRDALRSRRRAILIVIVAMISSPSSQEFVWGFNA